MCIMLSATISPHKILSASRTQKLRKHVYIIMVPSAASGALLQFRAKTTSKEFFIKKDTVHIQYLDTPRASIGQNAALLELLLQ